MSAISSLGSSIGSTCGRVSVFSRVNTDVKWSLNVDAILCGSNIKLLVESSTGPALPLDLDFERT